jgi:hypothetical protein
MYNLSDDSISGDCAIKLFVTRDRRAVQAKLTGTELDRRSFAGNSGAMLMESSFMTSAYHRFTELSKLITRNQSHLKIRHTA